MEPQPFPQALASWHDFYLAVASASAALLGLLFVGVSINLSVVAPGERADFRTRADVAFSNLLYLLGLSLIVLVPGLDPGNLSISLAIVAVLGLIRISRHGVRLAHRGLDVTRRWATIRRLAWTLAADLVLLYIAASLAATGDGRWLLATPIVVFVLLLGAADVAWDLLVRESEGRPPAA